jgi:hypothetical protein
VRALVRGYIQGEQRGQHTLFPTTLDDLISEDHVCRVIEAFVGRLDMAKLGFVHYGRVLLLASLSPFRNEDLDPTSPSFLVLKCCSKPQQANDSSCVCNNLKIPENTQKIFPAIKFQGIGGTAVVFVLNINASTARTAAASP